MKYNFDNLGVGGEIAISVDREGNEGFLDLTINYTPNGKVGSSAFEEQ